MTTNLQEKINFQKKKRRIASLEECKLDLKNELPIIFNAFYEACRNYEIEVANTPIYARARGYEASLLNSKMIQSIHKFFPEKGKFGRYKRFILNINGYNILFKKFNNKGLPMNIKTKTSQAIAYQQQLSLFDDFSEIIQPILFFGYKKNNIGIISDAKLTYIDESKIMWSIDENDINTYQYLQTHLDDNEIVTPKLKTALKQQKKA